LFESICSHEDNLSNEESSSHEVMKRRIDQVQIGSEVRVKDSQRDHLRGGVEPAGMRDEEERGG
jgi:hypothetical protein